MDVMKYTVATQDAMTFVFYTSIKVYRYTYISLLLFDAAFKFSTTKCPNKFKLSLPRYNLLKSGRYWRL